MNFANQSFSPLDIFISFHKTSRLGLVIGAMAEMKLSELWYITAEPRYTQKGMTISDVAYTIESPEPVAYGNSVYKVNYLELPILLKAKFGAGDCRPFLLAGPNIGWLLSAVIDLQLTKVLQPGVVAPPSQDLTWDYKTVDVCFDFGGGGEFRLSRTVSLLAMIRYSFGLSNTINHDDDPTITRKSTGIQMLLGAMFDL
jgi:hypothetical protein